MTTAILSLTTLLDEIAALAPVQELIATLCTRAGVRLHVAPAPGAARTPLVAAIAANTAAPVVYVVSTTDAALRAYDDLRQWLGDNRVLIFPASDALPYEHMSTGSDILAARMRVLRRLAALTADDSAAPPVIVASVRALMQPTLTPAELRTGSIRLERGAPCVLDDLMEQLIDRGYRYAPVVEEPGEVNRRGGIIDVFPPGDDLPLRIEFFGDEIDSLRRFDPLTQRSEAQISAAIIGPPHEFPLWRRDAALQRMRDIDTSALRREALDEWLQAFEHIRRGERFEGRAFFAPFFREEAGVPATLLHHLPPGGIVALNDALLLAQHAAELDHQAETRRRQQIDAGELPAAFPRPYLRWHELIAQAEALTLADFSNNERPLWDVLLPASPVALLSNDGAEPSILRRTPDADPPDERFRLHLLPEHLVLPADLFGGQI
ncbi:MAG: transcription-repair coupling factor, partial [Roseiflexus sp.]|nr:transcription-repair coupling factor [Roseiflexus sp.]